jgi:hypothetical protein
MAAAASRGHLRASHGDREQVIAVLKDAFVQGRLTKDELDARVGRAFAARTGAGQGGRGRSPDRSAADHGGGHFPDRERAIGLCVRPGGGLLLHGLDGCRGADAGQLA